MTDSVIGGVTLLFTSCPHQGQDPNRNLIIKILSIIYDSIYSLRSSPAPLQYIGTYVWASGSGVIHELPSTLLTPIYSPTVQPLLGKPSG